MTTTMKTLRFGIEIETVGLSRPQLARAIQSEGDPMKIMMRDGRAFHGTPLQIVRAMQDRAFGVEGLSVRQYIAKVAANALELEGLELAVKGETDDELAASLVDQMIRTALASSLFR